MASMNEQPRRANHRGSRRGSFMRRRKKQSLTAQVDCVVDDDADVGWMTKDPSDMKLGAGFEKGTASASDKLVMRNRDQEGEPIMMSAEEAQSQRIFRNMGRKKGIVNSLIKPKSKKSGLNAPPPVASMRTEDTGDSEELLPTFVGTRSSPNHQAGVVNSNMEGIPVSPQGPKSGTKTRAYDFDDLLEPSKPSSSAHNVNSTQPEALQVINDVDFFDFACFDEADLTFSPGQADDVPPDVREARFVAFGDSPVSEMSQFVPDDDRLETTQPPTPDVDAHAWANEKPFFDFGRLEEAQSSSMQDETAAEQTGREALEASFFIIPFEDDKSPMPREDTSMLESMQKNTALSTNSADHANASSPNDERNGREPKAPEANTEARASMNVHHMPEYPRRAEKERLAFVEQTSAAEDPGISSLIPRGLQARRNTDEMASVLFIGGGRSPADAVGFWREQKAAAKSPPYAAYVSRCVAKYRQKIAPERTPEVSCLSYS